MLDTSRLNEVSKGLLEAAEMIKGRGLYHGQLNSRGTVCIILAISEVFRYEPESSDLYNGPKKRKAFERVQKYLECSDLREVYEWNDSHTAEEVMTTLREIAYNE